MSRGHKCALHRFYKCIQYKAEDHGIAAEMTRECGPAVIQLGFAHPKNRDSEADECLRVRRGSKRGYENYCDFNAAKGSGLQYLHLNRAGATELQL